jgi:hypothetical protein
LILAETKQLITDLPLATKKKFMKDFSKIIGKLRKFGVEVFKEILKDSVKESLKFLLNNVHHIT